jgi:hypothetical protein
LEISLVLELFSEMFPHKPFILIATLPFVKRLQVLEMVNVIFDLLEDGKWQSLTEMADKSGLHEFKLEIVTNFLAEYDFIKLDKAKRKARLAVSVVDFLKKIKPIEKDEG